MNRKKYITLTLILSLLCMNKTYAACTQEEIDDFKKIEDEYKITYEINRVTKDYMLNIYNPSPEKYKFVLLINGDIKCTSYESGKIECRNIPSGSHKVEVVSQSVSCKDTLKTFVLELPKYNQYADDPLCEGIDEFVLCQPTYEKEIDYDTFVSRVNTYKRTKSKENIKEKDKSKENNVLIEYIKENLVKIVIILTFIVLLTITIIVTLNSARKSRRLE